MRAEQERTLGRPDATVEFAEQLPASIEGVVLSNELLDALPVHRVIVQGGQLREVYVGYEDGAFRDVPGDLSDPSIAAYFTDLGLLPAEGAYAEVNLAGLSWIARVATSLRRGYVLTFDYGYEAADLYAPWRRDGTLLCFYGQSASSDPYRRIGRQDITSSVDFTSLAEAGERAGLTTVAATTQSEFLARLGIGEAIGAAAGESPGMEEYFARRAIVLSLIDPAKLGRIRVLLQAKGAPSMMPGAFGNGD
jgi:SAM-dependent MidA family methyltransferase